MGQERTCGAQNVPRVRQLRDKGGGEVSGGGFESARGAGGLGNRDGDPAIALGPPFRADNGDPDDFVSIVQPDCMALQRGKGRSRRSGLSTAQVEDIALGVVNDMVELIISEANDHSLPGMGSGSRWLGCSMVNKRL